jgi:hypothetical protein
MVDYGSRRTPPLDFARTTTNFSYLLAGGEQDAFVFLNTNGLSVRIVGSFDNNAFTAGRKITVKVYDKVDATNYREIDSVEYTIGTDPNPHVDFVTIRDAKVTYTIDIVEVGNIAVPRDIDVEQVA